MSEKNLAKIDELTGDFSDELRKMHGPNGGNIRTLRGPNLPSYVDHHPEVDDVGRLSAEALAISYENAAKDIEAMGKALVDEVKSSEVQALDTVKELERYKAIAQQAVDECKAAAETYRKEAKDLFALVQARAMAAENVRQLCTEMVGKIKTV